MDLQQLMLDPRLMAIAVAAVLVIAVLAWLSARRRRTTTALLANRETQSGTLEIRDLDPAERQRFSLQWLALQSRFVDDPAFAVMEADAIVTSLLQTRGYPVAEFDRTCGGDFRRPSPRGGQLPVRARRLPCGCEQGDADTEALRTAMESTDRYALFEELVHAPAAKSSMEATVA